MQWDIDDLMSGQPEEYAWRWEEGQVNTKREHIVITYGDLGGDDPQDPRRVALVAAPDGQVFRVQFLIDDAEETHAEVRQDVIRELDYYLVKLRDPDPWAYAIYHCSTSSNVYSRVHWGYVPRRRGRRR